MDRALVTCQIEDAVFVFGVNADFDNAGSHVGHRLAIARLQAPLDTLELVPDVLTRRLGEKSNLLKSATVPDHRRKVHMLIIQLFV